MRSTMAFDEVYNMICNHLFMKNSMCSVVIIHGVEIKIFPKKSFKECSAMFASPNWLRFPDVYSGHQEKHSQ